MTDERTCRCMGQFAMHKPALHADRDGSEARAQLEREHERGLAAAVAEPENGDRLHKYGEVIWTTSRNDEGTISVTGANIVARAVMAVADEEMATLSRAVLTWAERFTPGDRWDREDLRDLETALDGTVEAHPTAHWRREQAELRAELAMFKRGGRTLGETIEWQCRAVLDATGLHHLIGEDGDGDWALVWEHLAELRPRAEKAEAALARVEALHRDIWGDSESCGECSNESPVPLPCPTLKAIWGTS